MKIGIGNDHAAVEMKMQIKEFIESMLTTVLTQRKAAIIRRSESVSDALLQIKR